MIHKQPVLILKTITYRLLGSFTTAIIVYSFSGQWKISIGAGLVELCVKPVIYYLHELAWYRSVKKSK